MRDLVVVARKELIELLGERASRRGIQVQAFIMTAMLGVLFPMQSPNLWLANHPTAILLFLLFPSAIAAAIAADAFAGERERKTLETLLATPLSDRAIIGGKAAAAITAALSVALVALIVATVTVNLSAHPTTVFIPSPQLCAGALLGAFGGSCASTAVAVFLSMRIPVARSVQQMVSLMFVLPIALVGLVSSKLGFVFSWQNVFIIDASIIVLGLVGLAAAAAGFHRERFFLKR